MMTQAKVAVQLKKTDSLSLHRKGCFGCSQKIAHHTVLGRRTLIRALVGQRWELNQLRIPCLLDYV